MDVFSVPKEVSEAKDLPTFKLQTFTDTKGPNIRHVGRGKQTAHVAHASFGHCHSCAAVCTLQRERTTGRRSWRLTIFVCVVFDALHCVFGSKVCKTHFV